MAILNHFVVPNPLSDGHHVRGCPSFPPNYSRIRPLTSTARTLQLRLRCPQSRVRVPLITASAARTAPELVPAGIHPSHAPPCHPRALSSMQITAPRYLFEPKEKSEQSIVTRCFVMHAPMEECFSLFWRHGREE